MATTKRTAALALVRQSDGAREVLLVHPGGPFWAKKDEGAWSLPKGELEPGEDPLTAAKREFHEETSAPVPAGPFRPLGEVTMKSGKVVIAFAAEGDFDVGQLRSNEIDIEWPPRSGKTMRIPECDRGQWCTLEVAVRLVNPAQVPLIERALG